MAAIPMIELWRGGILESVHQGHAVICDDTGAIVEAWGDPKAVIFPRSSCKMIQALPLLESGAAEAHGLTDAQLALACASHNGAHIHTAPVARWLADLGLGEADLRCGPQMPDDPQARRELLCSGAAPCQIHNNCSGKHAGFLTLAKHLGGGPEYAEPGHPVQRAVRQVLPDLLRDLGAPFPAVWDRLQAAHDPREAARLFAKILGELETRGHAEVVPMLDAALASGMSLMLARPALTTAAAHVDVTTPLRHLEIPSGCAADYDTWLTEVPA